MQIFKESKFPLGDWHIEDPQLLTGFSLDPGFGQVPLNTGFTTT
jgi:hypothetical protein